MAVDYKKKIAEQNAILESSESTTEQQIQAAELVAKFMELELKELELQERQYSIKDLKARIADREIREKQIQEDRESAGRTIAQQEATDIYRFSVCTHKKGGNASPRDLRVLAQGGNAAQYAVMKHQMINGDIWVRCLRCGKTWNPPVEKNFFFDETGRRVAPQDGVFSQAKFERAVEEYKRATMFETNNSMSTSVQCRFTRFDPDSKRIVDAADTYRENIASTTLR